MFFCVDALKKSDKRENNEKYGKWKKGTPVYYGERQRTSPFYPTLLPTLAVSSLSVRKSCFVALHVPATPLLRILTYATGFGADGFLCELLVPLMVSRS